MQERPWPNTHWIMFGAVDNFITKFLIGMCGMPDFVIDNSDGKRQLASGGQVRKPDSSLLSFASTHSIVIVTYHYWDEMESQLLGIGFPMERVYVALRDFAVFHTFENYALSCGIDVHHPEPKILNLELSAYCNCRCLYCAYHGEWGRKRKQKGYMKWEILRAVVDQVKQIPSIVKLDLTGAGEIFLQREWFDMTQYVLDNTYVKHGTLYTNGMLLNAENAKNVGNLHADSVRLVVSLDGESSLENDRYRIGSKYETVKLNLLQAHEMLENDRHIRFVVSNARAVTWDSVARDEGMIESESISPAPKYLQKDFPFAEFACYRWPFPMRLDT